MKQLLALSFLLFVLSNLYAQTKPVQKTSAAAPGNQKSSTAKTNGAASTAVQTAFLPTGNPEEFKKLAVNARSNFDAGKLDDSRFALQQMMAELDMIIGKEVLKLLPSTIMDKAAVTKLDNVTGASGFLGVIIHREYGKERTMTDTDENSNISVEIISNSPLISSINSLLSLPLIGNTGDNKVIKIAGYKALLTKHQGSNNQSEYEMQMPLGSSLITLKAPGYTQEQVAQIANTLPVPEIAKMLQ